MRTNWLRESFLLLYQNKKAGPLSLKKLTRLNLLNLKAKSLLLKGTIIRKNKNFMTKLNLNKKNQLLKKNLQMTKLKHLMGKLIYWRKRTSSWIWNLRSQSITKHMLNHRYLIRHRTSLSSNLKPATWRINWLRTSLLFKGWSRRRTRERAWGRNLEMQQFNVSLKILKNLKKKTLWPLWVNQILQNLRCFLQKCSLKNNSIQRQMLSTKL